MKMNRRVRQTNQSEPISHIILHRVVCIIFVLAKRLFPIDNSNWPTSKGQQISQYQGSFLNHAIYLSGFVTEAFIMKSTLCCPLATQNTSITLYTRLSLFYYVIRLSLMVVKFLILTSIHKHNKLFFK